jgi:serine/threonine protein kinase
VCLGGPAAASLTDRDGGGKMKYCATCKTVYPADFQCCPKDGSALSSSSELLPGMVIRDKYQILEQIGSGGMATVYKVRHLPFNEIRAIKLINSQLADGDQFSKRLRSEAVIARKLQHPNAVHVDDLDRTEDGRPFIVMEYVEGQNLRTVIRQDGPLPTLRALHIAAQAVSALAAAHKLGIIHRDIKPDNIHLISLPDGSDFVKVLDFGIAKFTQDLSSSALLTGSGLVVGTPQYVSPEQAMGKHSGELDGRSDLYTLGIVLYEMLTGRLPFDSDTPVGLLVHHLHTTPVPPEELRPDLGIPHSVSEMLMKALEKNPAQRFRNADEMLDAITSVEEQVRRVPETGTGSMKTLEKTPEQHFPNVDPMLSAIPSVEEQVRPVQETGTTVPRAEVGLDTPKPPITNRMPSANDVRPVESTSFPDATINRVASPGPPPSLPMPPLGPDEEPSLHDVREELLAAAYEPPTPRRMLYVGIAVFAVICLAALGIYQWRSASAKPAEQPAQKLHDQTLPEAGTSTQPAAGGNKDLNGSAIQPSNTVPAPQDTTPLARPADLQNQGKLTKIKEFVSQGRSLSDQGEYLAAIDMFDAALRLDPHSSEAKAGKRRAEERMQLEQALPNEPK